MSADPIPATMHRGPFPPYVRGGHNNEKPKTRENHVKLEHPKHDQPLHPKTFVDAAAKTMPLWYVAAMIERGWLDPAFVKRGRRPPRVAPIGFAYLTLNDELGVLVGSRRITVKEGADMYRQIYRRLAELWRQATRDGVPRVFVEWPRKPRIELMFLRRAVEQYRAVKVPA